MRVGVVVLVIGASVGAAAPVAGAGVGSLVTPDPLTAPSPPLAGELRVVTAPAEALERISPLLFREAATRGGTLRVLVVLGEPVVGELATGAAEADEVRGRYLASLQHRFVANVAPLGVRALRGYSQLPVVLVEVPAERLVEMAGDPLVRAVQLDRPVHAHRAEGGALIRANQLLAQGGTGRGVGIAVLDSGIDASHPEFAASGKIQAWGNYTDSPGDGRSDDNGHGTACAGIAAGSTGGMAPQAHLWALKVLDAEGRGSDSQILAALNDVYAHRNDFGGVKVVSISIGGSNVWGGNCDADNPAYATAIQQLVSAGIVVFVSAGNAGCSNGVEAPACVSGAVAVGAVYDGNVGVQPGDGMIFVGGCIPEELGGCQDAATFADKIACYSNSGERLDILAPANCATTPQPGGYKTCFGGTSAACPYAAGVAAQILSLQGSATPSQIKNAMMTTGRALTDSRNGITRRRIDAVSAYQALAGGGGGGGSLPYTYWVPVGARLAGAGGAQYFTDLGCLNVGAAAASIEVWLHKDGSVVKGAASVPAGAQAIFRDILGQLGQSGKGTLAVHSTQPLKVTSRTYNKTPAGTFGQYYDGYTVSDGISAGQSVWLPMLTENADYRTNIAITNTGSSPAQVTVTLYGGAGGVLASYSVSLAPGETKQENQPFKNRAGQTNLGAGYAKVTVSAGSGIIATASVLDAKTSDPTTIPAKP